MTRLDVCYHLIPKRANKKDPAALSHTLSFLKQAKKLQMYSIVSVDFWVVYLVEKFYYAKIH